MKTTSANHICQLQRRPENIRNICILAHVDHGKTTLADTLVASNGIISSRMAGKLRYMDSREDEQLRGITMKSSAISLHHTQGDSHYLVNLMDSPGHIDFSSEVSTAVRLCDGCIVVVDVVEGVCPQTHAVLRQAWQEHIKPVLVLNKIDRLILKLKMTAMEAHLHLLQLIQQVNAITGELFATDVYQKDNLEQDKKSALEKDSTTDDIGKDYSIGLEHTDDSHLYFSPDQGNVVFASAIDGWGFCISQFAELYSAKLGLSRDVLLKTLWGDFYLENKTKRIKKGAQAKGKKPLFVQFILENIWAVYDSIVIAKDKERTEKIAQSLKLKLPPRDMKSSDPHVQVQALFSKWLPLSTSVLNMVVEKLPSPLDLKSERVERLLCPRDRDFNTLPTEIKQLKQDFQQCSSADDVPVVVFVSKMFVTDRATMPQHKQKPLTREELESRRENARQRHSDKMAAMSSDTGMAEMAAAPASNDPVRYATSQYIYPTQEEEEEAESNNIFIAVARVFSGTIKCGSKVHVLGPKHDAEAVLDMGENLETLKYVTSVDVNQLFLFMGRELELLEDAPAGNIIGIGGLQDIVLKSATLSSTVICPPFCEMLFEAVPIIRVAIEPKHSRDMSKLMKGMKLLNQSDANIQVMVQETGEHVLVAAGEIHLQKCIEDLTEKFAGIEVNVSDPIVPFRETVVPPPEVDMVNEVIDSTTNALVSNKTAGTGDDQDDEEGKESSVQISTSNGLSTIRIKTKPLPEEVISLLDKNLPLIKILNTFNKASLEGKTHTIREETMKELIELKSKLDVAFIEADEEWKGAVDEILCFGPRRQGPNVLLNHVEAYQNRGNVWTLIEGGRLDLWPSDSSIISGFQMSTHAGPLCREPMRGVCYVLEEWVIERTLRTRLESEGESLVVEAAHVSDELVMEAAGKDTEDVDHHQEGAGGDDKGNEERIEVDDSEKKKEEIVDASSTVTHAGLSGQLMSVMKSACHQSFQLCAQRVMLAMYSCEIQAPVDVLGRLHAVLSKCNGRVLSEELRDGSSVFIINSVLPVIDSFGFADEMRKKTSGLASPQLCFSHWEVLNVDPFWVPSTEEEILHFGEKADSENIARRYVNLVRKRKGLYVDEQIVEHGEKQRTLAKKV